MKNEIRGLLPGSYTNDEGTILDICVNKLGVNIYFVDMDKDVYYHWWGIDKEDWSEEQFLWGSPFDTEPEEEMIMVDEVRGVRAGERKTKESCILGIYMRDSGVKLVHTDEHTNTSYNWIIGEDGKVVSFNLGVTK